MKHRAPRPHDHPAFDAPSTQLSTADPNATHPVAGVPTDADGFLAFLQAGVFNDEQLVYLRAALPVYEASPATLGNAKAQAILAVWRPIVAANPAPAGNAFNR